MKSETQDTRSKGSREKPGALLNEGRWRVESDSLGEVKVQAKRLWGAQTQRSLEHFCIGQDLNPAGNDHRLRNAKEGGGGRLRRLGAQCSCPEHSAR
ncbi:MAG: hypothetical protein WAN81_06495 [Candidatus Binataceae bacterium]